MTITVNLVISSPAIDRVAGEIIGRLDQISKELSTMSTKFEDDVTALGAAVAANTAAITAIAAIHKQDGETIASLNQQIADLKAANPALDLTGLEADIASLAANNVAASKITAPVLPPPPVIDPLAPGAPV